MARQNLWFQGESLSGKTGSLIQQFGTWLEQDDRFAKDSQAASQSVLTLSVNSVQRRAFGDRFVQAYKSKFPIVTATPRSFFRDQVILYFPLLIQVLNLSAHFPILLRIENEQELAGQLWAKAIASGKLAMTGLNNQALIRRLLDLYLLAANSGQPLTQIPQILHQGLELDCEAIAETLEQWREYCWQHGFLTYGIIAELYSKYLLPHPFYRKKLLAQVKYLLVDDADEHPAIAYDLSKFLVENGVSAAFSFNPQGSIRSGLGADSECWQELAKECEFIDLNTQNLSAQNLSAQNGSQLREVIPQVLALVGESWGYDNGTATYAGIYSIQTLSRSKLLRTVAEEIAKALISGEVKGAEIAVIAPGLDRIAIYTLTEILKVHGIEVLPLEDQSSLSLSSQVRSLLTLLAIIYPNLGELVDRDRVAEMLVALDNRIDPVRAGLIADRCFVPGKSQPQLLESQTYHEWHRLGHGTTEAYEQLRHWIASQTANTSPILTLDRALHKFLMPRSQSYTELKTFEALMETAQHYWQIGFRLGWQEAEILAKFIQLILAGTVTANPFSPNSPANAITLATIYQYRMARSQHKWQFWLDAGSALWLQGGAANLFGAPLFKRNWNGQLWTQDREEKENQVRLQRLLRDLIGRASDRLYLGFSELAISGQMQEGVLLPLLDLAEPLTEP
jgi:hypothetical protein